MKEGQSGTRPVRTPSDTASVRERTPSFSSTAARWYLTVCVVICKSAAISLLLKPLATRRGRRDDALAHHQVGVLGSPDERDLPVSPEQRGHTATRHRAREI